MPAELRPSAPVSIIYAVPDPPVLARGTLVRVEGEELDIDVASSATIPAGARLIVQFGEGIAPREVRVERAEGRRLHTRTVRTRAPDKREYPRVHGAVDLRYRVPPGEDAGDAWMRGEDVGGADFTPDPFMNFSATGLAFDDLERTRDGELLLLTLGIPHDDRRWRATARVVRIAPIPVDERDEGVDTTHRVAIAFERIPEEAVEALGNYTLRIQDAWLEGSE